MSTSSAIAVCCYNAAAMLELADQGDIKNRHRVRAANNGQAQLLREAAKQADEMLAALKGIDAATRNGTFDDDRMAEMNAAFKVARAVIARAESR